MSRAGIHENGSLSDKIADKVVATLGSWHFIIIQTVIVAIWITLNVLKIVPPWDIYPFILLNLLFSTQAAYASPLILMAANRQSQKDRKRDNIEAIEIVELLDLQKNQLEILTRLDELQKAQMEYFQEQNAVRGEGGLELRTTLLGLLKEIASLLREIYHALVK